MTRCFNSAFGHFSAVGRHLTEGVKNGVETNTIPPALALALNMDILLLASGLWTGRPCLLRCAGKSGMGNGKGDDIQRGSCVFSPFLLYGC